MVGVLANYRNRRGTAPVRDSTRLLRMERTLIRQEEGNHVSIGVPGEGIEPSWVARVGNSSHDYTDRPEVTDAIVWAKQWPGSR